MREIQKRKAQMKSLPMGCSWAISVSCTTDDDFMRYFEYGSYKGHASREFTCICPLAKASVKFITVTVKFYE